GGFEAVDLRHLDVEQIEVGLALACELDRLPAIGGRTDRLVAKGAEALRETEGDQRIVVGDKDSHRDRLGKTTSAHVPTPLAPGRNSKRPPSPCSTSRRTRLSPSPEPAAW